MTTNCGPVARGPRAPSSGRLHVLHQFADHLPDMIRLIDHLGHSHRIDASDVTSDDDLRFDFGVGSQQGGQEIDQRPEPKRDQDTRGNCLFS